MTIQDPASPGTSGSPQARQRLDDDQLEAAQAMLEAQLRQMPGDTAASIDLSRVLLRRGQLRASVRVLQQAARTLPRNAPLIIRLVQCLIVRGETLAARDCLDVLAQAPAPPAALLLTQARMRWLLGEIPVALELSNRAREAGLSSPDEFAFHAMLLQFSGRVDEAVDVLEHCVQRWPDFANAAAALVALRRQTPESNRLDALQAQLRRLPAASREPAAKLQRAEFEYAVFKTLDDLGRHDEAWPALSRCNALMLELNPYDEQGETAVTDAFIRAADALPATGAPPASAPAGPTPIFVVGMPRSGTTLLERMLSNHAEVVSAGEILDFWRQLHFAADVPQEGLESTLELLRRIPDIDFAELGRRYLEQTQWRAQGHRFYVDKLPINVRMVPFIHRALPHAPILHLVRDPMDVCFSNFKAMFGNAAANSYDLAAIAHHYKQYLRLTAHWHAAFPGAMLDVSSENLVRDPGTGMRRILERCGLQMQEGCLRPERNAAPVATPSSVQVREPIHTRSVGQWRDYAAQLEPLQRALG